MNTNIEKRPSSTQSQKGALLVVSILLLIVLTIVSISSITSSIISEQSIRNTINTQKAFQSSETALRSAETFFDELIEKPVASDQCIENCNIIWRAGTLARLYGGSYPDNWWTAANSITNEDWWNNMGHQIPSTVDIPGVATQSTIQYVATQPTFIAEELAFVPDDLNPNSRAQGTGLNFYRITSKGSGGETTTNGVNPAQVFLQAVIAKRYN